MKLECKILIEDRAFPAGASKRFTKCNLYVGARKKSDFQNPQLYLRTANNTYQYRIVDNVQRIVGRCEKKVTIGFRTPQHYLMMNCESDNELVKLVRLLRKLSIPKQFVLDDVPILTDIKKPTNNPRIVNLRKRTLGKENMSLSPSFVAMFRQQYPYLWGVMQNLQVLELKAVENVHFPVTLGQIRLVDVSFKEMRLRNNDLLWLNERPIRSSLKTLELTKTKLTEFPMAVIDCLSLDHLNLSNNNIEYIPHGIYRLQKLRVFVISCNNLYSLPADITLLKLSLLDISSNYLYSNKAYFLDDDVCNFRGHLRLEDWAALSVDHHSRLHLTTKECPGHLLQKLRSLSRCVCDKITPRYSNTECYVPLHSFDFTNEVWKDPQNDYDLDERMIYLQYNFCTFLNHCINRKFRLGNCFRLVRKEKNVKSIL